MNKEVIEENRKKIVYNDPFSLRGMGSLSLLSIQLKTGQIIVLNTFCACVVYRFN
jgi:hypothetical protein